jgi:alpha-beta hydrolase superfamily lysophospholipase
MIKQYLNYFFNLLIFIIVCSSCSTSAFFYAPYKALKYQPDSARYFIEEINFSSSNGKNLNGWFFKPKNKKVIGTILHFHGNGGNISYQYQFSDSLVKSGFQVMVFDYQGFGKSEGKVSQENVLEDGIAALHYIKQREDVKNTKLILFGQSLGGHLSCVVAAREQKWIDALVIEGAFTGHERMAIYVGGKSGAPKWLAKMLVPSKYNAIDEIEKVSIPKLIIHSSEDQTCPFFMSQELYEKAIAPKAFWEIKGPHIQCSQLYRGDFVKKFIELIR